MSQSVTVTRTFRFRRSSDGTARCCNGSHVVSADGALHVAQIVLGAVCVGIVGYYGNEYYYDFGAQAAEWIRLVLKTKQLDVWKPVILFMLTSTACLINTLCLFCACLISFNTASIITKTVYGILYHTVSCCLYLATSVFLIVSVNKEDIRNYRDGYYFEPFMAAGIIGVINSVLYLLGVFLSCRSYRGNI